MEQRCDRSRCRALRHDFAVRHNPNDSIEDVTIRQGDDLVHAAANYFARRRSYPLHPQPIDDAINLIERDEVPFLHAALHGGGAGGFDADDADGWVASLERHGDTGDEPAAADRNDDHLHLGEILIDFQAKRALAGDELEVVEGVNQGEPTLLYQLECLLVRLVPDTAVQDDLGAVPLRRLDFGRSGVLGHDDDGGNVVEAGCE